MEDKPFWRKELDSFLATVNWQNIFISLIIFTLASIIFSLFWGFILTGIFILLNGLSE